ncbi:hypothetical protein GCM10023230_15380 [Flavobacterium hankyongi]|uniref:Secreted protein (Por secretion system target) n=1 Tax=Flavobacterium hankyongi TaxID=1176532 RepID=A0ABP8ZUU9_9FLAO
MSFLFLVFCQTSFYGQSNTNNSQWGKNGPASAPASPVNWANGNAQGTNSHFREGESVPTRIELVDLTPNVPASVTFNINIIQGSNVKHAFDFFTGANRIAETVNPLDGLSGYGPRSLFTFPIPNAGNTGGVPAGYYDQTAIKMACQQTNDAGSPEKNSIWIYNGTVTGITYVWGNEEGTSTQQTYCTVTFIPTATKVLLALGCHVAAENSVGCGGWGIGNGASAISGSPYHFHIQQICSPLSNCVVLGSQDQQMASDAVIIPPTCSVSPSSAQVCAGSTATFTATGINGSGGAPYSYSWTGPNGFTATTASITVGVAGIYSVIVRDKNGVPTESPCTANLIVNELPNVVANDAQVCTGLTVQLSATPLGGTWSGANISASGLFNASGLSAGPYNVTYTYTNGNQCTNSDGAVVTVNALSTVVTNDAQVCTGFTVQLSATPPGGTWSGANISASGLFNAAGLSAGLYNVTYTYTDGNQCTNNDGAVVTVNALPVVICPENASAPVLCGVTQSIAQAQANSDFQIWMSQFAGLNPTLNSDYVITPSYTYSAGATPPNVGDAPLILAFNNPTIISTSVTVKWTVINEITGCINDCSATWTLEFGCAVQCIATSTNVLCNGAATGSISVVPTGGALPYNVYLYRLPDLVTPVAQVLNILTDGVPIPFNNLTAGNYVAITTDATTTIENGSACTATINQPSALEANDSHTDVLCNGGSTGSVTLNFSGGTGPYMVNFNGGGFASQVSGAVYSNLAAGNYPWVVRDVNNCTYEGSEAVGQPSALEANDSHTDVLCNGGSTGSVTLNFSGGTGPYMVNFNGGGFASQVSGAVYSNLAAGNYPWVVRDVNNCTYEGSETVGQPSALEASDSHTDVLCNGGSTGSVTLNFSGGTGPYMVNFNGGGFASQVSGAVYSNLAAGNYPWVVRDASNCTYEGSETVGQPSALEASDSHTDVLCNGGSTGSVTLNFSGGTGPYMVNFNGGGFASQASGVVYSNLAAGNYPWIVRDANNCTYEGSEAVDQPSELQVSDSHTDVLCNSGSTGSVTLNFSGGTGPYMINFNGGGFASQVSGVVYSNLAAGNYPWIVRDANNCIYEGSEQVGQPTEVELSLTAEPENCAGTNSGSITATFSGGAGSYTISIDGSPFEPATSPHVFNNLGTGLHTVVLLDRNDCRDSAEIRVSLIVCDGPHCTYTQGYYGAYNGSACTVEGAPTNDYLIMLDAITDVGGTFDFGRVATGNYFRLFASDITGAANIANNKIFIMLPGGGTPRALVGYDYYDNPAGVPSSWRNDGNPLTKSGPKMGAINNNLLSQTMTLFFNIHVDPTLLSFPLEIKFATQDVACGSSVPIPGTYKEFTIPSSVINYFTSHGGATVGNLFNLANDALGGMNIGGLNHSDVNKAVDAINNAFDQCRVRVPLQVTSLPTTFVYNSLVSSDPIFTVYPVPFRDQLTIRYQFDYISKAKIDIYNSTGTLLMSQDDNDAYFNKEVTITPKFSVGEAQLYFVKVTTDRGQSVLKVISEK